MQLHEQRTISRPIDDVFAYVADFSNIADWDPGVHSSRSLSDGPPAVGARYEVVVRFGTSKVPIVYEITELDPPSRVVLVGTSDRLKAVDEILFSPVGERTEVDYKADLTFAGVIRFVVPLFSPIITRVGSRAVDGMVKALEG